jgi:osmotically-inducible protein OsmY
MMASVVETTFRMDSPQHAALLPRREEGIVQARATQRLQESSYPSVRRVVCEFHGGMLTLRGRVSSYYLKQIAQTLILGMKGVEGIDNQLEVLTSLPPAGKQDALPAGPF